MKKQVFIKSQNSSKGFQRAFKTMDDEEVTGLIDLLQFKVLNVSDDGSRVFILVDESKEQQEEVSDVG